MNTVDFGLTDYETVWRQQQALVRQRLADEIPDTLMLGEHPHVLTCGRGTKPDNLLAPDIPVFEIERGGDVTYHGPGQLIAYPIFRLEGPERDLHAYLRRLEEVVIRTLAEYSLTGERNPGWTGVWIRQPQSGQLLKIASIGVAVKSWVTYHGIGLNISTDLDYFRQINPCGLEAQVMTNLSSLQGGSVEMVEVKRLMTEAFSEIFPVRGN